MCIVIKVFSNKAFKVRFKCNHHTDKQTCYVLLAAMLNALLLSADVAGTDKYCTSLSFKSLA